MDTLGKWLVLTGLALTALGTLVWLLGPRAPGGGLLPGDLSFQRGPVSIHFPIVTCLVVSVVLTLLFRLLQK